MEDNGIEGERSGVFEGNGVGVVLRQACMEDDGGGIGALDDKGSLVVCVGFEGVGCLAGKLKAGIEPAAGLGGARVDVAGDLGLKGFALDIAPDVLETERAGVLSAVGGGAADVGEEEDVVQLSEG